MAITNDPVGTAYSRLSIPASESLPSQMNALAEALDGATPGTETMGWTREYQAVGSPSRRTTTDTGTDAFTQTAYYNSNHLMVDNQPIFFTHITTTTNFVINQTYYVLNATATTFQIEATIGGGAVDLTGGNGNADYCLGRAGTAAKDVATDTFTLIGHGMLDGQVITFLSDSGTLGNLVLLKQYYVVTAGADTFQISETLGGAAFVLGGANGNVVFNGQTNPSFGAIILSAPVVGCVTFRKYMRVAYYPKVAGNGSSADLRTNENGRIKVMCGTNYKVGNATFSVTTDFFTCNNHGMVNGDKIFFTQLTNLSGPTGVMAGVLVYVVNATTHTFQVYSSPGASFHDLTGDDGTATFVALHEENWDQDTTASNPDYDGQPYSTGVAGTLNVYATSRWCALFGTVAAVTPLLGGKNNNYWAGIFEVKRENPNDDSPDTTGRIPFCYISGSRIGGIGGIGDYSLGLGKNYWGDVNANACQYSAVSTSYGRQGQGWNSNLTPGLTANTTSLCPGGQKFAGLSVNMGWALDIFMWQHGPYSLFTSEAVCVGRFYGLKASPNNQGSVGSTVVVKIDSDYFYSSTGTDYTHQILPTYNISYGSRFVIPQDIWTA